MRTRTFNLLRQKQKQNRSCRRIDAHHEKTDVKVFVLSYQKKDGRSWPRPSFFWYDTDFLRI